MIKKENARPQIIAAISAAGLPKTAAKILFLSLM